MMNDIQLDVLECLVKGPLKKSELFQKYISICKKELKVSSDEYFSTFIGILESKSLVQLVPGHSNQVWCILTREGYYKILEAKTPQKLLRLRKAKLRRALLAVTDIEGRDVDWDSSSNFTQGIRERLECSKRKISELKNMLTESQITDVKMQVLETLLEENGNPNRRTTARDNMIEKLTKELPGEAVRNAESRAMLNLERGHEKDGFERGPKIYGKCFFCGTDIVVKDAAEEAKLLTKYGGRKGKIVCCDCFDHMTWMEKQFGGADYAKDTPF